MTKTLKSFFFLVLLFSFNISNAADLVPHKATYTTQIDKGINIKGTAIRELKKLDDGTWRYQFDVDSFAAEIKESVIFNWRDDQVVPLNYRYSLSGMLIRDKYQKVHFDWSKGQAKGEHDGKKWKLELKDKALDRLGYQLQLVMDAQQPDHLTKHTPMDYHIIHRKKYRPSRFLVQGEEQLKTVHGTIASIKVIKKRDSKKIRQTHLWFSKEHPFLLLKMIQVEKDGEQYEINLSSAEVEGKKLF